MIIFENFATLAPRIADKKSLKNRRSKTDLHIYGSHDMVTHMKTTIDISDTLFEKTRRLADRKGNTFREVVETALSSFLKEKEEEEAKPFILKDCSVKGNGLVDDLKGWDWDEIMRRAYEGRGG